MLLRWIASFKPTLSYLQSVFVSTNIKRKMKFEAFENSFKPILDRDFRQEEIHDQLQMLYNFAKNYDFCHAKEQLYRNGMSLLSKFAEISSSLGKVRGTLGDSQRDAVQQAQRMVIRKNNGALNDLHQLSLKKPCKVV